MSARAPRVLHPHHRVSAVLVVHDGERWLAETLAAVSAQTRPVQHLVAVDVGSADGSAAVLVEALGTERVVTVERTSAFAASVSAGLARLDELQASSRASPRPRRRAEDDLPRPDPVNWLWLLHDDCAPDPTALQAMLDVAVADPSIAVLGPKARDWDDPRQLVEVGLSMDRAGRRETGLERREIDQGQHDARFDVLAVGTAAMLVRADVYAELGGLEVHLPLLREDMDLGWRVRAAGHRVVVVPDARMRHVRAAWTGRRPMSAVPGRPTGIDRRHSLLLLLANLPTRSLFGALPRLLLGALVRTVAFLLTRQVVAARDEVAAVLWCLRRSGDLRRMRAARRRTRRIPAADVKPFFVGRTARLRGYVDAAADWLAGGAGEAPLAADPEDPDADPADLPPSQQGRAWRALRTRPGVVMVLLLGVAAAVSARGLYGDGVLAGGDLLPVPPGARALWADYAASWHRVGAGTDTALSPAVALVAAGGTLLFGHVRLLVTAVLLGAVPLAALSAYLATRRLPVAPAIRVWASASYAVLPVVTGSVAQGRLDAVVAVVATPLLVAGGYRLLSADPRHFGWRLPFGYGLGLAAAMAFAPPLWSLAAVGLGASALGVVAAATPAGRAGALRRSLGVVLALVVPLLLLLPWSLRLFDSPALLVLGSPALGTGQPAVPTALDVLLLRVGGSTTPPLWAGVGLVLAAAAGLVRQRRQLAALAGWGLALGAATAALVVARGFGDLPPAVPVAPVAVAACGLLLAAAVAASGALGRLGRYDFGWRQPVAGGVALAAVLTPLVFGAGWLVRGAGEPLRRQARSALPSVVLAEADRSPGSRVLWLDASPDGVVRYSLTTARGLTFGDGALPEDEQVTEVLDGVVRDLTVARGSNAAEALATFNVRYVAVPNPAPASLATGLDAQAGLSRVSFVAPVSLWRTLTPTGRLTVIGPAAASAAVAGEVATRDQLRETPPVPLPSRRESARAQLLPGPPGRLLVLAERADDEWVAELDGKRLAPTTAYDWAQAFSLPAGAGVITLRRDGAARQSALIVQALVLLVVVVLAAPPIRRREDESLEEAVTVDVAPETTETAEPVAAGNVRALR
ncbi:MAG TPA: glycosyltransferase family 2 protein [Mycobacteriales bacterium]|nr:glycosyltransferase family 2 protein [Mycobacteriales bacterium]